MNIQPKNININFISYSKHAFKFSALFIISGIILFFVNGIKASIDFTGGTVINFNINKDVYNPEFDLRTYLKDNIDPPVGEPI